MGEVLTKVGIKGAQTFINFDFFLQHQGPLLTVRKNPCLRHFGTSFTYQTQKLQPSFIYILWLSGMNLLTSVLQNDFSEI